LGQNKRLPVLASDGNNDKNNPTSNVEYFYSMATKRFDASTSADREVQRVLIELLNQMDGFDQNKNVKSENKITMNSL